MTLPVPSREEMLTAFQSASARFIDQLSRVDDPSKTAIGHWDIATLATHVSHIVELYPQIARGEGTPVADHRRISDHWDKKVAEDPERDLGILTKRIEVGRDLVSDALLAAEWERQVAWLGGLEVPVWCLPGVLVNEFEIHGLDIATGIGERWDIPPHHARLAIGAHVPFLPAFVNEGATRDLSTRFALHIRGGVVYYLNVDHGSLHIDTDKFPVDCHISVDPVAYLLIGYGRTSQWGQIARGKTLTWGRKPWLAFRLSSLFQTV